LMQTLVRGCSPDGFSVVGTTGSFAGAVITRTELPASINVGSFTSA
jgi:hypothetical protein